MTAKLDRLKKTEEEGIKRLEAVRSADFQNLPYFEIRNNF